MYLYSCWELIINCTPKIGTFWVELKFETNPCGSQNQDRKSKCSSNNIFEVEVLIVLIYIHKKHQIVNFTFLLDKMFFVWALFFIINSFLYQFLQLVTQTLHRQYRYIFTMLETLRKGVFFTFQGEIWKKGEEDNASYFWPILKQPVSWLKPHCDLFWDSMNWTKCCRKGKN